MQRIHHCEGDKCRSGGLWFHTDHATKPFGEGVKTRYKKEKRSSEKDGTATKRTTVNEVIPLTPDERKTLLTLRRLSCSWRSQCSWIRQTSQDWSKQLLQHSKFLIAKAYSWQPTMDKCKEHVYNTANKLTIQGLGGLLTPKLNTLQRRHCSFSLSCKL